MKIVIACLPFVFAALGAAATAETVGESGNPLPRFVSLKSEKANMRTGPGRQYPIEWTYRRKGLPLEVVGENGSWRRVRDHDGDVGWMHVMLLNSRRMAMITGGPVRLTRKPVPSSTVTIIADEGVIGTVLECDGSVCELEIGETTGWIERSRLWGVYPFETID